MQTFKTSNSCCFCSTSRSYFAIQYSTFSSNIYKEKHITFLFIWFTCAGHVCVGPGLCLQLFQERLSEKKTNVKMHAAIQQGIVGSHTRYILYPISYGPPSKIVTVRPGRGIAGLLYTFDLLKSIDHIPD